jgi:hypothetical protein
MADAAVEQERPVTLCWIDMSGKEYTFQSTDHALVEEKLTALYLLHLMCKIRSFTIKC